MDLYMNEKNNKLAIGENLTPVKKNNRIFKGNPNYVNFLNREIKEFFQNKLVNTYNEKPYFQDSKVDSKGKVMYKKHKDFENGGGSIWTNNQKEVFFNCLARYSIHRIDAICDNLPEKSEIEIMNYYDSLAKELKRLKDQVVKRRKYHQVKIIRDKNETEYRYKSLPNRKNLIKYEHVPAAYEMSEKFIKMEEIQAEMICQRERSKTNDENQRFKRQFNEYTIRKRQKRKENDISESQMEEQETREEEEQGAAGGLINYDIACELTKCLYLNNKITPLHNIKLVPKLHYKSLIFFDEIVRLTTEKILLKIIEHKVVLMWLNQRQMPFEENSMPLKIAHGDIYRAINNLNLFEIPKSGHQSLEKTEGTPMRINNYFSLLPESLDVEIGDNIENKDRITLSNDSYKKLILNDKDRAYGEKFKAEFTNNEFTSTKDSLNHQKVEALSSKATEIPHISSLPNSNPTILNETRLTNHKYTEELEELIEFELVDLELQKLDEHDSYKSSIYEHALLTYLTLYKKDDESVKDSMYNNDEAEAILAKNKSFGNDLLSSDDIETDEVQEVEEDHNIEDLDIIEDEESLETEAEKKEIKKKVPEEQNNTHEPTVIVTKSLLHNFSYIFASYNNDSD